MLSKEFAYQVLNKREPVAKYDFMIQWADESNGEWWFKKSPFIMEHEGAGTIPRPILQLPKKFCYDTLQVGWNVFLQASFITTAPSVSERGAVIREAVQQLKAMPMITAVNFGPEKLGAEVLASCRFSVDRTRTFVDALSVILPIELRDGSTRGDDWVQLELMVDSASLALESQIWVQAQDLDQAQTKLDELQLSYLGFQNFNKLLTSGYAVLYPPEQVSELANKFWSAFWTGSMTPKMITFVKDIEELAKETFVTADLQVLREVGVPAGGVNGEYRLSAEGCPRGCRLRNLCRRSLQICKPRSPLR